MVFLVKFANNSREQALTAERHAYDVALVVRNVSSNISRSEAALARFVLDEDQTTSGNIYSSNWELAGYQIQAALRLVRPSVNQERRVAELQTLYTGAEASLRWRRAPPRAAGPERDQLFLPGRQVADGQPARQQAQRDHRQRAAIAWAAHPAEPVLLRPGRPVHRLSSWLGVVVGLGAVFLGVVAVQALRQNAQSRRRRKMSLNVPRYSSRRCANARRSCGKPIRR